MTAAFLKGVRIAQQAGQELIEFLERLDEKRDPPLSDLRNAQKKNDATRRNKLNKKDANAWPSSRWAFAAIIGQVSQLYHRPISKQEPAE